MNILLFGAGVLGSLYAARLKEAGQNVTILARGQRLADLREHGIVLEHALTGNRTTTPIDVVEGLAPEDAYDLVVVLVRKDQVSAVLPTVAVNEGTPSVLFMVNNPSGYEEWKEAVGRDRLLVGFAGAGGFREEHVVRYVVTPGFLQPTMVGELDGRTTPRLKKIVNAFKQAGFPVAISRNMEAWQKTHVAMVSPMANAIYMAGGDSHQLAKMPDALRLMVRAIREGFRVLRALGVPITPPKLKVWGWAPEALMVAMLRRLANTKQFKIIAAHHANAARDEMQQLADEFKTLALKVSISTPAIDELSRHIGPRAAPLAG